LRTNPRQLQRIDSRSLLYLHLLGLQFQRVHLLFLPVRLRSTRHGEHIRQGRLPDGLDLRDGEVVFGHGLAFKD
jgi:hypothetical protein